jgi:hypothetical protein
MRSLFQAVRDLRKRLNELMLGDLYLLEADLTVTLTDVQREIRRRRAEESAQRVCPLKDNG